MRPFRAFGPPAKVLPFFGRISLALADLQGYLVGLSDALRMCQKQSSHTLETGVWHCSRSCCCGLSGAKYAASQERKVIERV